MDYDVRSNWDEELQMSYPAVMSSRRPRQVLIEPDPAVGVVMSAADLERTFVPMSGTELWVPAREAYVAFGGDLAFDVVMEIGFDGVRSPLREVRYRQRPDKPQSVTSVLIRTIRLDALVRRAISENRTAYRRISDQEMVSVSPEERIAIFGFASRELERTSPRRPSDKQLQRVVEVYLRAISERRSPTKAVEDELRLPSRDAAKKLVQKARAEGLLPPAPGPRRGGVL